MKFLLILLIKFYRLTISPLLGVTCRFEPSCSIYSLEAFERYNVFKASWLMCKRLSKCHPWHKGGHDPLP